MSRIFRTPRAVVDLIEISKRIGVNNLPAARRFLKAAERVLDLLASMPEMGSPWESANPSFADLRFHRIPKFNSYLIFYRPIPSGILVIRIIHASRDLNALFE